MGNEESLTNKNENKAALSHSQRQAVLAANQRIEKNSKMINKINEKRHKNKFKKLQRYDEIDDIKLQHDKLQYNTLIKKEKEVKVKKKEKIIQNYESEIRAIQAIKRLEQKKTLKHKQTLRKLNHSIKYQQIDQNITTTPADQEQMLKIINLYHLIN